MSIGGSIPAVLEGVELSKLHAFLKEYGGNGWTVWRPDQFTKMGFKSDDLPCQTIQSGEGKWAITDADNQLVDEMTGVWNLAFLMWLARHMGIEYERKLGRGSQARAISAVLIPKLEGLMTA